MKVKKIASQGYSAGAIMLAGSIPTNSILINISIGVLILSWLLEGEFDQKLRKCLANPILIAFFFFYVLHILGLLYTRDLDAGVFNLEKKLSILILPLALGSSNSLDGSGVRIALWAFILSCFSVAFFCFSVAVYKWVSLGDSSVFFYDDLISMFGFQAIYFGMYLAFGCQLLLMFLPDFGRTRLRSCLCWAGILFFVLFTVLLSARMAMLVMIVIVFVQGYRYSRDLGAGRPFILGMIMLTVVSVTIISNSEFLKNRVMSVVNSKLYFDPEENNANGLTLRLVKWECSIIGALESPILGVGPGDCQGVLQNCYKEKKFWGAVFEYNSHNQYLQTLLGLGIVGVLVFLYCLFGPLWTGSKKNEVWYAYFAFIIGMSFLTESMLERQQGVIFYSFFSSLLVFKEVYPDDHA